MNSPFWYQSSHSLLQPILQERSQQYQHKMRVPTARNSCMWPAFCDITAEAHVQQLVSLATNSKQGLLIQKTPEYFEWLTSISCSSCPSSIASCTQSQQVSTGALGEYSTLTDQYNKHPPSYILNRKKNWIYKTFCTSAFTRPCSCVAD